MNSSGRVPARKVSISPSGLVCRLTEKYARINITPWDTTCRRLVRRRTLRHYLNSRSRLGGINPWLGLLLTKPGDPTLLPYNYNFHLRIHNLARCVDGDPAQEHDALPQGAGLVDLKILVVQLHRDLLRHYLRVAEANS
jgi:hypothetical protein